MDKRLLEQQFRKSDAITLLCENTGAVALMQPDLVAGGQSGRRNATKFKITYILDKTLEF